MKKVVSPYMGTKVKYNYLDILKMPKLKKSLDDEEMTIEKKYEHRPDKLAEKLYGNEDYWFVFTLRNMDKLKDPIFDFKAGTKIMVPSKRSVEGIHYGI